MSLQSFFNPKAIALVGASTNPEKIGRQILDNILHGGFKGKVFPINLKEKKIAGLLVYNDLSKIPKEQRKDLLVIIAIPADFVLEEILKCATLGIKNIIIISSGFKESGDSGDKLEKEIISLASKYNLNILGPNCLGLINVYYHLNAAFAVSELRAGRIALLSQSGAIGSAALDWVKEKGIGLSHFISLGNKAVLSENEIIAYLAKDKQTDVVVIYLESIKDGKKLMNLVSNLSPVKPVLILKAGQSSAGEKLALSHTGSLTGSSEVVKTGLQRAGAVFLDSLGELFLSLILFKKEYFKNKVNSDLYLLTNAGGLAVLTADELSDQEMKLGGSFDLLGDADNKRYEQKLAEVLSNKKINNVLVILTPQTATKPKETAEVIVKHAKMYPQKLIMASFVGGESVLESVTILKKAGVPVFDFPEEAVHSLKKLISYKNNLNTLRPYRLLSENKNKKAILKDDYLSSLSLLKKYGIKTVPTFKYSEEKIKTYKYPLVLKAVGPDFLHKTDKQAVLVNISSPADLKLAAKRLIVSQHKAFLNKDNYLIVQEMAQDFQEIIIGFKRDVSFGAVMMIGWGGVYAEVFKEVKLAISDLTLKEAKDIIKKLKIYPILNGARNQKKYDLLNLAMALYNLARLANEHPEIKEADINPLFVFKKGVLAADVRIIL